MPRKSARSRNRCPRARRKLRRKAQSHRVLHWIGGRAAATLVVGAALSVGGVTEAFQGVHFLVLKDLDAVKIVEQQGSHTHSRGEASATTLPSNSFFKLSRSLPNSSGHAAQRPFRRARGCRRRHERRGAPERRLPSRDAADQCRYPQAVLRQRRSVRRHHPRQGAEVRRRSRAGRGRGRDGVELPDECALRRRRARADAAHAEDRPLDGSERTSTTRNRTSTPARNTSGISISASTATSPRRSPRTTPARATSAATTACRRSARRART